MGCDPAARQYGSKTASDRMLRGRSPRGVRRGRIFARLFACSHSFVRRCERSSMLSIGGRGMLSNAVHPCWIVQVPFGRRIVV